MIYFYNPWIFILLPLIFLPILLHLLFEKKSPIIKFTYLHLINKILKQFVPRKRIIDIIVLILRCLIIFLIITYFARPVGYFNPKKTSAINIIFAIDNSFSTKYKIGNISKLEMFKTLIKKLLKRLSYKNVRFSTIIFNENVSPLNSKFVVYNYENIASVLDKISPTYKGTNLSTLVHYVTSIFNTLEYKDSQNKVIVLTDLAEHMLSQKEVVISTFPLYNQIDWIFCYPDILGTNFYVKQLDINKQEPDIVEFKFVPESNIKTKTVVNAKLVINDTQVDTIDINFSQKEYKFNYVLTKNSKFYGYISLQNDNLNEDNNFYFSFVDKDKTQLLCIVNEPFYIKGIESKKYYLEKLSSIGWDVEVIPYEDVNKGFIINKINSKVKNIVFVDMNSFEDIIDTTKLEGKNVIIFPSENLNVDSYEKLFSGLEFVELQEGKINNFNILLGEDEQFNNLVSQFEYQKIVVFQKYRLTITSSQNGWKVLLKFSDGTPAVVNKGNIYVFSFSISKKWSNFVYKPLFLGIMKYIIERSESETKYKHFYFVSEPIPILEVSKVFSLIENKYVDEEFWQKSPELKIYRPGIYRIETEDKNLFATQYVFGINISPEESNIKLIPKDKLKDVIKKIPKCNVSFVNILEHKSEDDIIKQCLGKEYSHNLLKLIILLFLIETILSRTMRKMV